MVPGTLPGLPAPSRRRHCLAAVNGAPDRIRTCDLWLRRPTLYPTELRALKRIRSGHVPHRGAQRTGGRRPAVLRHRSRQASAELRETSVRAPGPHGHAGCGNGTLVDPGTGGQAASGRWRPASGTPGGTGAATSAEPGNVPWIATIGCQGGRNGRDIPVMQPSSGRGRKPLEPRIRTCTCPGTGPSATISGLTQHDPGG